MAFLTFLFIAFLKPPADGGLQVRFIGNSAFEISDGEVTLLTDFPYRSGAFGYMTFATAELRRQPDALCLFSHRHADHFDPAAIASVGCSVAGPREVMAAVAPSARAAAGSGWRLGSFDIHCLPTEHAKVEHCSYLVRWRGRRLLISGDIESLDALPEVSEPLDAIFVPAWLVPDTPRVRARFPGARIVIHHHRSGEPLADCGDCLVPAQGSIFTIVAVPSAR